MKKPEVIVEIPEHLQAAVNTLVRYYSEGWRAGYLEGFNKMGAAIIRPIGAIGGTRPQTVNIELTNLQLLSNDDVVVQVHDDVVISVPEPEFEEVAGPPTKGLRRKKREKTTATCPELDKASEVLPPPKKSERKSIFDALKKG